MKRNKPILYDTQIISRVKKYLEDNVDKTYLDVGMMTKQLQERYPEYGRRKFAPFRALVEQAYRVVSKSYGLDQPSGSGEDTDASDVEVMDDNEQANPLNNMMNNLYAKPKNKPIEKLPTKSTAAAESIDISSEESSSSDMPNGASLATKLRQTLDSSMNRAQIACQPTQGLNKTTNSAESTFMDMLPAKKLKLDVGSNDNKLPEILQRFQNAARPLQQHQQQNKNNEINDNITMRALSNTPRPRKYKKEITIIKSRETFNDIGGMEKTLKELCELLLHLKAPDFYYVLGSMPPRGLLLHGASGCGKTLLAHAIAGQLNLPLIEIVATELIAGISGESEERIRDIFEQAQLCAPCVLFIDEIDAISSNRANAQKDMERRVVTQLISSLDNLKLNECGQSVLVIGATTKPELLDPALRRVGRFDHEIAIPIPNRRDRRDIFVAITDCLLMDKDVDFDKIAELTPGYVGADLMALVSRAAAVAVKRKLMEHMRAYHAEAEKNITIVDLDEDDDEVTKDDTDEQEKEQTKDPASDTNTPAIKDSNINGMAVDEEPNKCKDAAEPMHVDNNDNNNDNSNGVAVSDAAPATAPLSPSSLQQQPEQQRQPEEEVEAKEKDKEKEKEKDKEKEKEKEKSSSPAATTTTKKLTDNPSSERTTRSRNHTESNNEISLLEWMNWLLNPIELTNEYNNFTITMEDFMEALKVVQPSAKREGFITVPDVTWNDIGSLQDIRKELKLAVLAPVKYPELIERLGLNAPSGVLLCGPPGCGKTLLAKAIANEAGINFISVKGPELMNMYVGESERAVRACFQRARNSAPCVIFFDEFDSLCPKRSESNESGSGTRVVNQLLTEMDGIEQRQGVYILAASNRPDIIDPAILRPGRLDKILYVGMPDRTDREEILNATTKNRTRPVLHDEVDFSALADRTEGYTGADLACLVREAAMLALREALDQNLTATELSVQSRHFDEAINNMRPSVTETDRKVYEKLRLKYATKLVRSV